MISGSTISDRPLIAYGRSMATVSTIDLEASNVLLNIANLTPVSSTTVPSRQEQNVWILLIVFFSHDSEPKT